MADNSNDPAVIWQAMVGEMEKGFNSFANQAMASPEFSKVMNQVGGVSAGAQKQLGELMEKYLLAMNLPSRAQMVGMAERLQSIEGQLNEIKAMLHQVHHNSLSPESGPGTPRPPVQTRRCPSKTAASCRLVISEQRRRDDRGGRSRTSCVVKTKRLRVSSQGALSTQTMQIRP